MTPPSTSALHLLVPRELFEALPCSLSLPPPSAFQPGDQPSVLRRGSLCHSCSRCFQTQPPTKQVPYLILQGFLLIRRILFFQSQSCSLFLDDQLKTMKGTMSSLVASSLRTREVLMILNEMDRKQFWGGGGRFCSCPLFFFLKKKSEQKIVTQKTGSFCHRLTEDVVISVMSVARGTACNGTFQGIAVDSRWSATTGALFISGN